jgi:hypothetical protein
VETAVYLFGGKLSEVLRNEGEGNEVGRRGLIGAFVSIEELPQTGALHPRNSRIEIITETYVFENLLLGFRG